MDLPLGSGDDRRVGSSLQKPSASLGAPHGAFRSPLAVQSPASRLISSTCADAAGTARRPSPRPGSRLGCPSVRPLSCERVRRSAPNPGHVAGLRAAAAALTRVEQRQQVGDAGDFGDAPRRSGRAYDSKRAVLASEDRPGPDQHVDNRLSRRTRRRRDRRRTLRRCLGSLRSSASVSWAAVLLSTSPWTITPGAPEDVASTRKTGRGSLNAAGPGGPTVRRGVHRGLDRCSCATSLPRVAS